jgi:hypothetical protein
MCIKYSISGKYIEESASTNFLRLKIYNHLHWNKQIDQRIPKWSGARYAGRSMFHIVNIDTLKSIYFAYFRFIMKYAIEDGCLLGCSAV